MAALGPLGCTDWAALSDCAVAQSAGLVCGGGDAAVPGRDGGRDAGGADAAVEADAGPVGLDAGPPLELSVALALPGRTPKFFLETDQGLRLVTLSQGGAGGFAEVLSLQSSDAGVTLESFQTFASGTPAPQLLDAAGGRGAFMVAEVVGNGLRLHFDPPTGPVVQRAGSPKWRVGLFSTSSGPAACIMGSPISSFLGTVVYPDAGEEPMALTPCFGPPLTVVLSEDQSCVTVGVLPSQCATPPRLAVQFGYTSTTPASQQVPPQLLFEGATGSVALARFPSGSIVAFAARDQLVVEPRGQRLGPRPAVRQVLLPLGSALPLTEALPSLSVDALKDTELLVAGTRFSIGLQTVEGRPVLLPRGPGAEGDGFLLRFSAGSWRSVALPGAFPVVALGLGDRFLVALDCAGNAAAPCLSVTGTVIVEVR